MVKLLFQVLVAASRNLGKVRGMFNMYHNMRPVHHSIPHKLLHRLVISTLFILQYKCLHLSDLLLNIQYMILYNPCNDDLNLFEFEGIIFVPNCIDLKVSFVLGIYNAISVRSIHMLFQYICSVRLISFGCIPSFTFCYN